MNFNYPQFLWALTALSIPIIIHLFNFRKTTRIFFSNTRFLQQVKQETTQKRKLKRYLVLTSRLLFLLFLVLAFAQPFLPAREQLTSQRNLIVYLDNSYSMSAPVEQKVRALDAGIGYVREVVELFPTETRFKLITNDFAPFSNTYKSKSEILDQLSQIRLSPLSRSFSEVVKRIGEPGNTVFWISDFQKSTVGANLILDSTWQIRLVPIEYQQTSNVFVDSIYLDNPFIIGGEKNTLRVRLRNEGARTVEGLVTKLTINEVQAATSSVTIEPNSLIETSFDLARGLKGFNKAVLSFSDYPVSFDNEFYFTLNYSGRLKIVEIKPDARPTHVENVYGNRELFDFHGFAEGNVDYSALTNADLVLINGINKIDNALNSAIQLYRNNNGSLFLIPGVQPDINSYKELLNFPLVKNESALMELDRPDFQNPFFENVFEEKSVALAMPQAQKVLDWGADRSAILRFKNGQPYLSRFNNTFVLASSLNRAVSDLSTHAIFVPVMYRIAASGKKAERKPYYYLSSSMVTVPADSLIGDEPARMKGTQELVPSQRRLGNKLLLEIPRYSINHGFYYVTHGPDTLDLLAFNLEKKESMLAQFAGEEVKTAMGGGNQVSIFKATSAETFSNEIKERYLGTPLWKYALILALIFLLAEVLLIRFLK
ncbi:MAG: BatA domain-containing protein [Cyclobacteriaceae bacterium]|nr:BatA domain-containing protein [Cyclobacteriaceae bacterium]